MIDSIAKSYATALFESSDDYDKILDSLQKIEKILEDEKTFKFLTHPNIEVKEKQKIIDEAFKDFDKLVVSFMDVIIENKRLDSFKDIVLAYQSFLDLKKGIVRVEIITNYELKKETYNKIIKTLEKNYQKTIIATTEISPDLIGGIVVKRDGYIIDNSLLNKLKSIKDNVLYSE